MASCVRNVYAKNRENPSIPLKVTIDNVGVPFLRHSDIVIEQTVIDPCLLCSVARRVDVYSRFLLWCYREQQT